MAVSNCHWFEVLMPTAAHRYGLLEEIEVGTDGMVRAPDEPGLGAKIDFELIRHKTSAVIT
jgi:L-alanine-DL-glutamate epimerase-like enolase superfamily enzyme